VAHRFVDSGGGKRGQLNFDALDDATTSGGHAEAIGKFASSYANGNALSSKYNAREDPPEGGGGGA